MNQGRPTGIRMCQLQFHTGFISEEDTTIKFVKSELDEILEGHDHYQDRFVVTLSVFVSDSERRPSQPAPWVNDRAVRKSEVMFSSQIEKDETVDNFVSKPTTPSRTVPERPERPAPPSPQPVRVEKPPTPEPDAKQLEEAVDLLNLNSTPPTHVSTPSKTHSTNFDLLGGLGDTSSDNSFGEFTSGTASNLLGDSMNNGSFSNNISRNSSQTDFKSQQNDFMFDPFGNPEKSSEFGWDVSGKSEAQKPNSLFSDIGTWNFFF